MGVVGTMVRNERTRRKVPSPPARVERARCAGRTHLVVVSLLIVGLIVGAVTVFVVVKQRIAGLYRYWFHYAWRRQQFTSRASYRRAVGLSYRDSRRCRQPSSEEGSQDFLQNDNPLCETVREATARQERGCVLSRWATKRYSRRDDNLRIAESDDWVLRGTVDLLIQERVRPIG